MKLLPLVVGLVVSVGTAQAAPKAVKPPPDLLVSIAVGGDASLDGVRAFANAVKPGAGLMLSGGMLRGQLAQMIGATGLDGFDPNAGITLLISDTPAASGGAIGFAVLGKISDDKEFASHTGVAFSMVKDHWALLGPKETVAKLAPFALAQLAGQPAPVVPTATAYVPNVLARYKPQIDAARAAIHAQLTKTSPGSPTFVDVYADGLFSVLADADRAVIALDLGKDLGAIDMALVPRAGTRLAQFVALQRPSDYGLVAKLPPGAPPMLFAGHFDSGPYHAGMLEALTNLYGGGSGATPLVGALEAAMKAANGELAMSVTMKPGTGMAFVEIAGITDERAAAAAFDKMFAALRSGYSYDHLGIKTTIAAIPPIAYDGISVSGISTKFDTTKATPAQAAAMAAMAPTGTHDSRIAVLDHLMVAASGSDAQMTQAIDAIRGKAAYKPAPQIATLLAWSRAHKDSIAMVMDMGGLAGMMGGPPNPMMAKLGAMLFTVGAADGNAHVRFVLPTASVAAMAGIGAGKP
ncbi:MAG TPA: hypothetical protein VGM88_28750 [Kofleriaceae bacterium]|jgi:hypothetical protein